MLNVDMMAATAAFEQIWRWAKIVNFVNAKFVCLVYMGYFAPLMVNIFTA